MLTHNDTLIDIDHVAVRIITPTEYDDTTQPLVMLNGLGAGIDDWEDLPQQLERQVLAIDVTRTRRLGFFGLVATMKAFGQIASQTINKLTERRVDLLGYSWGGLLAEEMAVHDSNRYGRVVLMATGPGGLPIATSPFAALEMLAPPITDPDSEQLNNQRGSHGVDLRAYINQQVAALTCGFNYFHLPNLSNQTLIMTGSKDPISPLLNASHLHAILPHSSLHIIEHGGHDFPFTHSAETSNTIKNFLSEPVSPRTTIAA